MSRPDTREASMSLSSMTGFARTQGSQGAWRWHWEVRSVNARGLDVRVRVPEGFEGLEQPTRMLANERFARGGISATLTLDADPARGAVRVNPEALHQVLDRAANARRQVKADPPRLDGILALRGVLDTQSPELSRSRAGGARRRRAEQPRRRLRRAQSRPARRRRAPRRGPSSADRAHGGPGRGSRKIRRDATRAIARAPQGLDRRSPESARGPPGRPLGAGSGAPSGQSRRPRRNRPLEIASDPSPHDVLAGGAQGRRLDFLAQEFNREANTLCSKSSDMQLTRIGLELKAVIDQLREQVQNIE